MPSESKVHWIPARMCSKRFHIFEEMVFREDPVMMEDRERISRPKTTKDIKIDHHQAFPPRKTHDKEN